MAVNRNGSTHGPTLITGGAGFIGTNLARHLLDAGEEVILFDNLSRQGTERNLEWLQSRYCDRLQVKIGDIRDRVALRTCVQDARFVFHFAAQVAVTTSLADPLSDFDINAGGTLGLLEEIRNAPVPPGLVFTSTNKVYGALDDLSVSPDRTRYRPDNPQIEQNGIDESRNLEFHSPYGCSKGAADQYVLDYARTFGLSALVFRMSCIYGPHQYGTEDQGWLAHFLIRAMDEQPITLYGDGKQVRDVLFVEDLVDALRRARANASTLAGQAFNMGGGSENTISLLELIDLMRRECGLPAETLRAEWRQADQRYYVSDSTRFRKATGWQPKVGVKEGVRRLHEWLQGSRKPSLALAQTAGQLS